MWRPAVLAVVLAGVIGCGPAAADPQSCTDFGGTVDADQICHSHTTTASYAITLSFPVDYPDGQALMAYLTQRRDQLVDYADKFPLGDRPVPYQLAVSAKEYRSTGTQSVVLRVGEDVGVHPVSSMKAFNYDVRRQAPITFDTFFKPGAFDVIAAAVRRDLASSTQMLPPRGGLDPAAYRNFAITDDAVIFFFDQDQLFGQNEGPLEAAVTRTELAPFLN
ncbi:esterase [Mycolicibacterium vinylchloridicum]|uniref:esterase n=1 Tax=Mycolicibacterium vinylchloridicum TaxID=2736928 RepID=UPI0015CC3075|nr:esterase [Mycolicibacterium vinylchloridicum]